MAESSDALPSDIEKVLTRDYKMEPIYHSVLPDKVFLNAKQEALSKKLSPDIEAYTHFVELGEVLVAEEKRPSYHVQQWTQKEKADLRAILQRIFQTVPGLLISAGSGEKVRICRVSNIPAPVFVTSSREYTSEAAAAGMRTIFIADEFFMFGDQYKALVHELIHSADGDRRVCYSKDWVEFTEPTIKLKIRTNVLSAMDKRHLGKSLVSGGPWPSLYGCENLVEGLAEYGAEYITNDGVFPVDHDFEKKFSDRLLNPTEQDIQFARHYKDGRAFYSSGKYDDAIKELSTCETMDPMAAMPGLYLSACYSRKSELKTALEESDKAQTNFDRAGVPMTAPDRHWLSQSKGYIFSLLGDYESAFIEANKLLSVQPPERDDIYRRYSVEHKLKMWGAASIDLYRWCFPVPASEFMSAGELDPEYALELLNEQTARFPTLGPVLQKRARFLETLGDIETKPDKQSDLYKRALSDFETTLRLSDTKDKSTLFACAVLNYKLKQVSDTRKYRELLAASGSSEAEIEVINTLVLELEGNAEGAHMSYLEVKGRLYDKRPGPGQYNRPKQPSPTDDLCFRMDYSRISCIMRFAHAFAENI